MKRVLQLLVLFLLISVLAFGQTRVTVGGSWWNADYAYEDQDGEEIYPIGAGSNYGPTISISSGKWRFSASGLFGSFPLDEEITSAEVAAGIYELQAAGFNVTEDDISFDQSMGRTDVNLSIGYRLGRYFTVFAGAKSLSWDITSEANIDARNIPYYVAELGQTVNAGIDAKATNEISESGVLYGIGVSAALPLGQSGLYGFASLSAMAGTMTYTDETSMEGSVSVSAFGQTATEPLDFEDDDPYEEEFDSALAAFTVGVGYQVNQNLNVNVGFRSDAYTETIDGEEMEGHIAVRGLIVTAGYSF